MTDPKYTVGDLVWAKMKGYCQWPSRIANPSDTTLKRPAGSTRSKLLYCVFFFGSNNYAWLPEDSLKPYAEFKEQFKNGSKSAAFKEAIQQIEDYSETGGLPTIEQEIATILSDPKAGDASPDPADSQATTSNDKQTSSSDSASLPSPTATGVQRDYSRTPFKSRKGAAKSGGDDAAATAPSPTKKLRSTDPVDDTIAVTSSPSKNSSAGSKATSKPPPRHFLFKGTAPVTAEPSTNQVNMNSVTAKSKTIQPSSLKFGFIGLGLMGQRLVKNLLNSGHSVTIWNRSSYKCKEFVEAGASKATTPADVIIASDITFACLPGPRASKEIVFGNCGILAEMGPNKGFVEMSSIDPETSADISEAVMARAGRYLEAPAINSGKQAAEDGALTIVCAGDRSLYEDCSSCFQAMSNETKFLGPTVGDASKLNLIASMLYGAMVGGLAECLALLDRTGLKQTDFLEILKLSPMNCPLIIEKSKAMIENNFGAEVPLMHVQKDLRMSLALAEELEHPVPIAATTNEAFKHGKFSGYSDHDAAAVYLRTRF
ncbi:putative oxidoreductase GLYR1-like protein, partial [Fragariocoptes setiger]